MPLPPERMEEVRLRAKYACEYCGVTEIDSAGQLTVDHYQPRSQGGTDDPDNLLYCCYRCNLYKAAYWPTQSSDPALWNPRQEPKENHLLTLADGRLHPISGAGQFTLQRLRLNRPALVEYRLRDGVQREELIVLQQHRDLLRSLKQLHDRLAETVAEQQTLLQRQRARIVSRPKRNGLQPPNSGIEGAAESE
jgi:hypothetical protein